ncbi:MAG: acyltransferase [Acidobacteriales bacterium]|nr:acyltransferase [Terriglobales bacterium]
MSLPTPRIIVRPLLVAFESVRAGTHFLRRVFIAEPLFKAYCSDYGTGVRTGIFVHWIQGKGDISLGDGVLFDGKCSIKFAARYSERPSLKVGSHSGIGHACSFTIGKAITIGNHCRIAQGVTMFDSPGHPLDPVARRNGNPAPFEDVRPISIGNNVWIGAHSIIFPGVTIGDNSVVAMGSSVMTNVPPNSFVSGNPARVLKALARGQHA